jgi:regulator of protease activity HflC (stomatin/prohibitin superfamily)
MKQLGLALLLVLSVAACSKVPAGYVGVKVYTMGGNKGVDNEVVGVGKYWLSPNVDLYLFPTFQQNYVWSSSPHEGAPHNEELSFQDSDGMEIKADVGISYQVVTEKVAHLFATYRLGIDEITHGQLRNIVRDTFGKVTSKHKVGDIIGTEKEAIFTEVTKRVNEQVEPIGIHVINIYSVGAMRPPAGVVEALNMKIQATQKAMQIENEVAQSKAEAEKAIAIARGEAEANRLKTSSLSPALLQYLALTKWNGELPQVTGSGGMPFINLKNAGTTSDK